MSRDALDNDTEGLVWTLKFVIKICYYLGNLLLNIHHFFKWLSLSSTEYYLYSNSSSTMYIQFQFNSKQFKSIWKLLRKRLLFVFETEARRIITTMNNDSEVLFMISTAKLKCSILVGSDVVYNSYLCSRVGLGRATFFMVRVGFRACSFGTGRARVNVNLDGWAKIFQLRATFGPHLGHYYIWIMVKSAILNIICSKFNEIC